MRCMIMAAGLGTRLYPLTGTIPKPMVPILNRPALEHILRLLALHEVGEAVVNLHHLPDTVTRYFGDGSAWGVSLRYAFEELLLGTAGGVKNNQAFLEGGTFLVMSGDALTDVDLGELLEAHRRRDSIATLAVTEVEDPSEYGVVVTDEQQRVVGFQEKPSAEEALSHLCNCGIYVFEPSIFERIPAGTFYDFGRQVLPELVADGLTFHVHPVRGYWSDVGSLREYCRGNADALNGAVRVAVPGTARVEGVWLGTGARVAADAELVPPVVVGDHCVVGSGAKLMGPTVLGDRCTVGAAAHLEACIAWDGVTVGAECMLTDTVIASAVKLGERVTSHGAVIGQGNVVGAGVGLADRVLEPCAARA